MGILKFLCAVFVAHILSTTLLAQSVDLRYPPTAQTPQQLAGLGWTTARDLLAETLVKNYRPGIGTAPGSTGVSTYVKWLTLWRWCDMLARNESDFARTEIARHLFLDGEKLTLVRPGITPPSHFKLLPNERLDGVMQDIAARERLLTALLPSAYAKPTDKPLAEKFELAMLLAWMSKPEIADGLFSLMNNEDYPPSVMGILADIAKSAPNDFASYFSLALALAVVYDQDLPVSWPHSQVEVSLVPSAPIEPVAFFQAWVAADKAKSLKTNLREIPASQLKYLVDAPLADTEFAWARKNVKASRSDFEKLFPTIQYRQQRITQDNFVWTKEPYTLANIANIGGICTDQAYYCSVAGKALGIPTLYFSGQGRDGGHAWFGYLKAPGRWNLNAGRFSQQNFVVGYALDPQNWQSVSDREIGELTDSYFDTPAFRASENDRTLAALLEAAGQKDLAARAFSTATAVAPRNAVAWRDRAEFLNRTAAPIDERLAVHKSAAEALAKRTDLSAWHQIQIMQIFRKKGDTATADKIARDLVSSNRHTRSDLSVSAAAQSLLSLLKEGKTDEAMEQYRRTLQQLASTGGGNLFYEVVRPFVLELRARDLSSLASTALDQARRALAPDRDSILDKDFKELSSN